MDKKIKLIVAGAILLSVVIFIVVLYVISAVMHKMPEKTAIILGAAVTIPDLIIAYAILIRPSKPVQLNIDTNTIPVTNVPADISYSDNLIAIDNEGITIKKYYFPYGAKKIKFSDIESVEAFKGGCARLWGTGDFVTWFGLDWGRMWRKMTFIINQKNRTNKSGFTCIDSELVAKIMQSKLPMKIH